MFICLHARSLVRRICNLLCVPLNKHHLCHCDCWRFSTLRIYLERNAMWIVQLSATELAQNPCYKEVVGISFHFTFSRRRKATKKYAKKITNKQTNNVEENVCVCLCEGMSEGGDREKWNHREMPLSRDEDSISSSNDYFISFYASNVHLSKWENNIT